MEPGLFGVSKTARRPDAEGGVESELMRVAERGFVRSRWFEIRVEMEGESFRLFIDDQDIFGGPIVDAAFATGTIALHSWGSDGVRFDDVLFGPPLLK